MEYEVIVIILITEKGSSDTNIKNLKYVFSDPFFKTESIMVNPPKNITPVKKVTMYDLINNHRYKKSIEYAEEIDLVKPVITILDTSISYETPISMRNKIENLITNVNFDLCYLCKWYDECELSKEVETYVSNDGIKLYYTNNARGTQALLLKERGKDFLLQRNEFMSEDIKPFHDLLYTQTKNPDFVTVCFTPNIVKYDIKFSKNSTDYLKLNECKLAQKNINNDTVIYIWFILLIILILIVAWAVIKVSPEVKEKKKEKEIYV
jgi:hypothetical protein